VQFKIGHFISLLRFTIDEETRWAERRKQLGDLVHATGNSRVPYMCIEGGTVKSLSKDETAV